MPGLLYEYDQDEDADDFVLTPDYDQLLAEYAAANRARYPTTPPRSSGINRSSTSTTTCGWSTPSRRRSGVAPMAGSPRVRTRHEQCTSAPELDPQAR